MGRKIETVKEIRRKVDKNDFFNLFFADSGCVTEAMLMMEVIEKVAAKKALAGKKAGAGKAECYG